jgi:hypothetical protein
MIAYRCVCGQNLQVVDEMANRKARCPKCRTVSVVPSVGEPPTESFSPAIGAPPDDAPTVSSHHDMTIKPPEPGPRAPKRKEANS